MMELDQFRKIYSDYRLAEARTKALKWSAWDNNCQRFNIQPPQQKRELYTRKVDLVPRIPEVVRTITSSNPLTKGLTSKLAGVDNRDQNEKFLTYGDLFNFEAIPSDLTDMIKRALEPLKIQIFIEGKTSIEQTQRTDGFTTSLAVYTLVKNIIATLITIRDGVTVDDRKRLRDGTNALTTLTKEGMNAQTIPENVAKVVDAVAGVVELDLRDKLETPVEDDKMEGGAEPGQEEAPAAPPEPVVDLTRNRTDAAADLHDQNTLNTENSTKATQALVPANQRDVGNIEKVEKGDITEALMAIRELQRELQKTPATEGQDEVDASAAMTSSGDSGYKTNPVDGRVIASESSVLARKDEGEKAIEALRKALTEAKFKPDDPKAKASWRPPENWKYDEATQTWSFTALPAPGSVPTVPGAVPAAPVAAATPGAPPGIAPPAPATRSGQMGTVVQPSADLPIRDAMFSPTGAINYPTAGIGSVARMGGIGGIANPTGAPLPIQQQTIQQTITPTPLSANAKLEAIRFAPALNFGTLMTSTRQAIEIAVTGPSTSDNSSLFYVTDVKDRVDFMTAVQQYLLVCGEVAYNNLRRRGINFVKRATSKGTGTVLAADKIGKALAESIKNASTQPMPIQVNTNTAAAGPPPQLPAPVNTQTVQNGGVEVNQDAMDDLEDLSTGNGKPRGKKRKYSSKSSQLHDLKEQAIKPRKKRLDILTGSGFIPVVFGTDNIQTTDRNLSEFKDEIIYDMKILRSPLPTHMDEALDLITRGEFSKLKQKYHFDQVFHLAVMVTTPKGDLLIEKNAHGVNIAKFKPYPSEEMSVVSRRFGKPDFTLGSLVLNTQKALGDKFFSYNAFGNNCQNFIFNLLRSNGLMTLEYANFVSQDMTELLKDLNASNPQAIPIINTITGALGMKQRYEDYLQNNPNPNPSVEQP